MPVTKHIIREGDKKHFPKREDVVDIRYTGTFENGTIFDESRTRNDYFRTVIGVGSVIRGWDEAVPTMSIGEQAILTISSDYGYGDRGFPGLIPPNATIIFNVELVHINGKGREEFEEEDLRKDAPTEGATAQTPTQSRVEEVSEEPASSSSRVPSGSQASEGHGAQGPITAEHAPQQTLENAFLRLDLEEHGTREQSGLAQAEAVSNAVASEAANVAVNGAEETAHATPEGASPTPKAPEASVLQNAE